MNFRHVGHACVVMTNGDFSLTTDPWFGEPLNHGTFHAFPAIRELSAAEIQKIDAIHISHIHQDHLSATTLAKFSKSTPVMIARHVDRQFIDRIALHRLASKILLRVRLG